jgi:hypothetical protein
MMITVNLENLSEEQQAVLNETIQYGLDHGYSQDDINIAIKAAYLESSLGLHEQNDTTTANGLYQYTDGNWAREQGILPGLGTRTDRAEIQAFYNDLSRDRAQYNQLSQTVKDSFSFDQLVYLLHMGGPNVLSNLENKGLSDSGLADALNQKWDSLIANNGNHWDSTDTSALNAVTAAMAAAMQGGAPDSTVTRALDGGTVTNIYDDNGRISSIEITNPNGSTETVSLQYDPHGNLIRGTDVIHDGQTTTSRTTVLDAAGHVTSVTTSVTPVNGPTTTTSASYVYDSAGNIISQSWMDASGGYGSDAQQPDGSWLALSFDRNDNLVNRTTSSADGATVVSDTYNSAGQLSDETTAVVTADGTQFTDVKNTYDSSGNLQTETTQTTNADGTNGSRTANSDGTSATSTDNGSQTETITYNSSGQAVNDSIHGDPGSADPNYSSVTNYIYNSDGSLRETVSDNGSQTETVTYNASQQLVQDSIHGDSGSADPNYSSVTNYRYSDGSLSEKDADNGSQTEMITYGANGQVVNDSIHGDPGSANPNYSSVTSYRYNSNGSLAEIVNDDGSQTTTTTYDANGRAASISTYGDSGSVNPNYSSVTRYSYNSDGSLAEIVTDDGSQTATTTYDANGRATRISIHGDPGSANPSYSSVTSYNSDGSMAQTFSDDGSRTETTTYYGNGQTASISIHGDPGSANPSYTSVTSYNSDGSLVERGTDDGSRTETITYNANGFPVKDSIHGDPGSADPNYSSVTSYSYNSVGLLSQTETITYTANGQPIKDSIQDGPGSADPGYSSVMNYNSDGSLAEKDTDDGSQAETITYNANGQVTNDSVHGDPGSVSPNYSSVTTYGYNSDGSLAERDTDNGSQAETITYNAKGQVTNDSIHGDPGSVSPNYSSVTTYGFNSDGSLAEKDNTTVKQDGSSTKTNDSYDVNGNLAQTATTNYDASGHESGTSTIFYDASGQETGMSSYSDTNGTQVTTTLTLDGNSSTETQTAQYPDGSGMSSTTVITQNPDGSETVNSAQTNVSADSSSYEVDQISIFVGGELTAKDSTYYYNGIWGSSTNDGYTYNSNGSVASVKEDFTSASGDGKKTFDYSYNAAGTLIEMDFTETYQSPRGSFYVYEDTIYGVDGSVASVSSGGYGTGVYWDLFPSSGVASVSTASATSVNIGSIAAYDRLSGASAGPVAQEVGPQTDGTVHVSSQSASSDVVLAGVAWDRQVTSAAAQSAPQRSQAQEAGADQVVVSNGIVGIRLLADVGTDTSFAGSDADIRHTAYWTGSVDEYQESWQSAVERLYADADHSAGGGASRDPAVPWPASYKPGNTDQETHGPDSALYVASLSRYWSEEASISSGVISQAGLIGPNEGELVHSRSESSFSNLAINLHVQELLTEH